jgi:hypothetical protein
MTEEQNSTKYILCPINISEKREKLRSPMVSAGILNVLEPAIYPTYSNAG